MFKNYLKTAWRNILRNKTTAIINLTGLVVGLTSCLLITVYIINELSYDRFQSKGDRIARVIMGYSFSGSPEMKKGNFTSVRVASVFKRTFPEVEAAVKMSMAERVVAYKNEVFNEKHFMYADPAFFQVFSFKLLQGNPATALSAPGNVLLTRSTAKKYFGSDDPLGKTLRIGDTSLYMVTGIMEDCPSNSQITFDFLASFSSLHLGPEYEDTYWDANYTTYLLLKSPSSIATLQAKLVPFMKKEMEGKGATVNFFLEPFNWIHLHSDYDAFEPNNNITYIYILSVVALLMLIIACSTYINISTARSIERAKEVGVRKVMGAEKHQLFWHFIGESFLLCTAAVAISLLVSALLLPYFNALTARQFHLGALFNLPVLAACCFFIFSISFLAGSYPALIISGFQPIRVLKGAFKNSNEGKTLRKTLIVFQFAISVFLVIATVIVRNQMNMIQHAKLGYNRQHVLVLPMTASMQNKMDLIRQELGSNPEVISVSRCYRSPVEGGGGYNMRSAEMHSDKQIAVFANPVDEAFIPTTGIQLLAGSNLSAQDIRDIADGNPHKYFHFILNESAARQLGWTPAEAIGKKMFLDESRPGEVKGVVKDFNFESLHTSIKPFILFPTDWGRELLVKLNGAHLPQTIAFLETKWKELVPGRPFEYRFMDDDFNKLYSAELRLSSIMNIFAAIAIILACLGLFGLSSYATQQKMKEIGVRKVLGASAVNIIMLLSGNFLMLIGIAICIATPLAFWALHRWVMDFAYRTEISWFIFPAVGLLVLLIALFTISMQSLRTALSNPVKSLRTE